MFSISGNNLFKRCSYSGFINSVVFSLSRVLGFFYGYSAENVSIVQLEIVSFTQHSPHSTL